MKKRYIAAISITLLGLALTPLLIDMAYTERGYYAHGGEYLFAPLCMVIALAVLETAKSIDTFKKSQIQKGEK